MTKPPLALLVLAVLHAGPQHGYAIAQLIKRRSDGLLDAKEGTLYPTLHALESQGLITSRDTQAQGRTRREYTLTPVGREHYQQEQHRWTRQARAIQAVLGGAQ